MPDPEVDGVRCMLMRGGTSKGAYFVAEDLPRDTAERDDLLLRIMGSPDPRQIDGIGGAHPLTSKVAVVSASDRDDADVEYLFLQVVVDQPVVTDRQNCGNILAGIGPFAIERGLVPATGEETRVRIHLVNSDSLATATVSTPGGRPRYDGDVAVDGVPGTAAGIPIGFSDTAGSTTGALFPTGNRIDEIDGVRVTCIDNGMPSVLMAAADLGVTGTESPTELEGDEVLAHRLASIRLAAAAAMGMGDVREATVPKLVLLAPPQHDDGAVTTRSFLPVRCHTSIGVLGGLTVGAGVRLAGTVADGIAVVTAGAVLRIEHPTGRFDVRIGVDDSGADPVVTESAVVRTARKLFDGTVFPHAPDRAKELA
jgi:4-oxalomesaconate tautomerase